MRNLLFCGLLSFCACTQPQSLGQNRLYLASSLITFQKELSIKFLNDFGHKPVIILGSSSTLARQVSLGAKCARVVFAHKEWINYLDNKGLLRAGSKKQVLGNRLVLASNKKSAPKFEDIKNLRGRIVIAEPAHVPLGKYTKQALESEKLYEPLSKQLIFASSARLALQWLEIGEADFGILYESDAKASKKITLLKTLPETWHEKITYIQADCT